MTTPTPEAVEAAAIAFYVAVQPNHRKPEGWSEVCGMWKKSYRDQARAALTAAYPLMVTQAKAEAVAELEAKHADEMDEVMRERDEREEWADRLAYAIAPMEVIGEHSSGNNPWENALDYLPATIEGKSE